MDPVAAAKAKARSAARQLVSSHRPSDVLYGRHHWMLVTVPEQPVAGEDVVIYFNKSQSDALRSKSKVFIQFGFNHWELTPEGGSRVEFKPAGVASVDSSDFWMAKLSVPKDSFELNFILSDGQQGFENNSGKDFTFEVAHGVTWDEWVDAAADRALASQARRQEEERQAAAAAEIARVAACEKLERETGFRKAEEARKKMERLQSQATLEFCAGGPGGPIVFKMVPEKPAAGETFVLKYNRQPTSLGAFAVPANEKLTLLYDFNGWESGPGGQSKVQMTRCNSGEGSGGSSGSDGNASAVRSNANNTTNNRNNSNNNQGSNKGDWWEATLVAPHNAVVMDFVVNYYEHYDNNNLKDYHALIGLSKQVSSVEEWQANLATEFEYLERVARIQGDALNAARGEAKEIRKQEARAQVQAVERRKVRHVLFTEPEVLQAGEEVTVYYNPEDTPLNGKSHIYLVGGWNRWTHVRKFGPVKMDPPSGPGSKHFKATVRIPKDAYKMDFVFADVMGGDGTYDNRGGFDYHLPVEGSPIGERSLYVVHVSVEMAPIAKVGGLGDVVTALGRAVKDQGHQVEVILPKYQFFDHSPLLHNAIKYETEFDWGGTRVFVSTATVENLKVWLIEPRNGFFNTQSVYGRYDDEVRFDFFSKAALEFLLKTGRQPDILHCHDWPTAHVAASFWKDYQPYGLYKPRVVFTIHNMDFGIKKIGEAAHNSQRFTTVSPTYAMEVSGNAAVRPHLHKFVGIRNGIDPEIWDPSEGTGDDAVAAAAVQNVTAALPARPLSYLKVAGTFCSPIPASSSPLLTETATGLGGGGGKDSSTQATIPPPPPPPMITTAAKSGGRFMPVPYTAANVEEGKKAARQKLRERLGLTNWGDKFMVGVVSRLTTQKGTHLIKHAAWRALERGGQFVLLGSAPDPRIQAEFDGLANRLRGADAAFQFKYDEPLSHLIYAGCDMLLVPSMFEPCGLTQLIAMRYGAIPIVRHTGGLRDTVFDVDFDKERAAWDVAGSSDWKRDNIDATNGFAFSGTDGGALDYAMNRAIDAWYNDKKWFRSLQKRVMEQDWSWNRPAIDYVELYYSALKA